MLKPSFYYLAGGAAAIGGPAIGYDLIRRGRQASAVDCYLRDNDNERRMLEAEVKTQKLRDQANAAGVDHDAVRGRYNELRDAGGA